MIFQDILLTEDEAYAVCSKCPEYPDGLRCETLYCDQHLEEQCRKMFKVLDKNTGIFVQHAALNHQEGNSYDMLKRILGLSKMDVKKDSE